MKLNYILLSLASIFFSCKREPLVDSETSRVGDSDVPYLHGPDRMNPFKSIVTKSDLGILTTLVAEVAISAHGSIWCQDKSLLANYVYSKDETYKLVYTIIDVYGTEESYVEDNGILPKLFLTPSQENYVSLDPNHSDKEVEITIPVFNRDKMELPTGNNPFTGEFIGTSNQFSIFYDIDPWFEDKPDYILAIEFRKGKITRKSNIRVPLPLDNRIFIADNEIHLFAKNLDAWIHRQIDENGNEIKRRTITTNQDNILQVLSLSFDKDSYLLAQKGGKIIVEKVDVNGKNEQSELADINDPFYNTWPPVKIADNTFITKFNGEFGNGWFTTRNDKLLELFYSKGVKGYKNLLTGEILEMENENTAISSVNRTTENGYAVVFYPLTEDEIKNNRLIILNRRIK